MIARRFLWLAAVAPCALFAARPAAAEIVIRQAEVAAGDLVVVGRVSPPSPSVMLGIGVQSIIIQPDAYGRFTWIGNEVPPSCNVTVIRGGERVTTGVAACGASGVPANAITQSGASGYSWRRDEVAPGIGGMSETTTTTTSAGTLPGGATETTTVRRTRVRPIVISPNDPRYALTEPPHGGQAEVEGARSGEMLYQSPRPGFYGNVRSKEN
jgi:hypothetical protein